MFHTEVVLALNLLLFLHAVDQFTVNGQQKWPVPYRYVDSTPILTCGHVTDNEEME